MICQCQSIIYPSQRNEMYNFSCVDISKSSNSLLQLEVLRYYVKGTIMTSIDDFNMALHSSAVDTS